MSIKNVNMAISDGGILTITVDLNEEYGLSKSGKNVVIATTAGNADVPSMENLGVKIGLNIFKKPKELKA